MHIIKRLFHLKSTHGIIDQMVCVAGVIINQPPGLIFTLLRQLIKCFSVLNKLTCFCCFLMRGGGGGREKSMDSCEGGSIVL